jgi:hypothetical protein
MGGSEMLSSQKSRDQAAESKLGRQIQSMDPFIPIRAAGWVSPTKPYSSSLRLTE